MPKRTAKSASSIINRIFGCLCGRRVRRAAARKAATSLMLAAVIAMQFSSTASATVYYWDTGSASWQTATDWTTDSTGSTVVGSAVPGSADVVNFNGSAVNG